MTKKNPDPQKLLPKELRSRWIVLPWVLVHQLVVVGLILGAGAALLVVGIAQGNDLLLDTWPIALILLYVQNTVFRWMEQRRLRELDQWLGDHRLQSRRFSS